MTISTTSPVESSNCCVCLLQSPLLLEHEIVPNEQFREMEHPAFSWPEPMPYSAISSSFVSLVFIFFDLI